MNRRYSFLPFVLCLFFAWQGGQEPLRLEPGQPIEREIASGQMHTYQIAMTPSEFLRVVAEQKSVNVVLTLVDPGGKRITETNLTSVGAQESISHEASMSGDHTVTVRALSDATSNGSYRLRLEVRTTATSEDRQQIAAERLQTEADKLRSGNLLEIQQAIEKGQQALSLWRELGDRYGEALTLNIIGSLYTQLRRREQAIEYYEQALAIFRELNDTSGEGSTLMRLGATHSALGRFGKAIECAEQSLVIHRKLKNRWNEGTALADLAQSYQASNQLVKAVEYYKQAIALCRETKRANTEAALLVGLHRAYLLMSRYEKAIESIEQSLTICRQIKDWVNEMSNLIAMGKIYLRLGNAGKAIECHEQALLVARRPNRVPPLEYDTIVLKNLSSDYASIGRFEKAIEYLEQARSLTRDRNRKGDDPDYFSSLGEIYLAQNNYQKAVESIEQSLKLLPGSVNQHYRGHRLNVFGEAYLGLQFYEKATEYFIQALAIMRELQSRDDEGRAFNNLMLAWKFRNRPSLAIFFGKQSVNAYQEIRRDIRFLEKELQQSFVKSKEQIYHTLADLLISQGRLPEAEQVIRMLKEEEYFEYIRRDQQNSSKTEKATLTPEETTLEKRYREIADQLTAIGAERSALLEKRSRAPEEEQRLAKLEADLVVAGQTFQKFLDSLSNELGNTRGADKKVYELRESQGLMEDLRELGKGVVALYTLAGDEKYRVILTTADFQKAYEYPIKAADLNRKALEFREVLQNPKYDPLPMAQELYKILFGPVAKDLQAAKAQMLMWSLDGVLRYVPMSALHDGEKYLVERYRMAVFTPASQARLKDSPSRNWRALGLGVTKSHGDRIPALPGVLDEMRGIIREEGSGNSSGVLPGTIKLDEAFTQEAMLSGLRQRPPVVHVASHFQFKPGNETDSALLLGDGNFLSLAQIKSLPNVFGGVELLTLSACNTATSGSGANGKEVEGFGVLAQRQGAKAVVASLWPVFDASTKGLMQEFYRLREAKSGATKSEALRQAQLKLLRGEVGVETIAQANRQIVHDAEKSGAANRPRFKPDPKAPYAHPYYWAPFILIGNWR